MRRQKQAGFTLAELLISLAILGVIATFAIPKILMAQQDGKKKAVFRETIAMLSALTYEGVSQGYIKWNGSKYNGDWILTRVNAVQICDNNANMLGCWTLDDTLLGGSTNNGFRLANGAVVVGAGVSPNAFTGINIDWNGEAGPNLPLQDQIGLVACYDKTCTIDGRTVVGGMLIPNQWTQPGNVDSTAFYQQIFSN